MSPSRMTQMKMAGEGGKGKEGTNKQKIKVSLKKENRGKDITGRIERDQGIERNEKQRKGKLEERKYREKTLQEGEKEIVVEKGTRNKGKESWKRENRRKTLKKGSE